MSPEGICVEIRIHADLDDLWEYTQNPAIHQQWDLRFSTIEYLPKLDESASQQFRYTTRIGFGLAISGEGESVGTHIRASEREACDKNHEAPWEQSTSALKFWSDQPISLIRRGSGYWQYIPTQNVETDSIRFLTWYDYETRFGWLGRMIDRVAFRPLIGWATAWSFDCLRRWLEEGTPPARSLRSAVVQLFVQVSLALIWIYQGIVPKLLIPDAGELAILQGTGIFTGIFNGAEPLVLTLVGVTEVVFGLSFLFPHRLPAILRGGGTRLFWLNIVALMVLAAGALFSQPAIFVAPFNPLTLTLAMIALSGIGLYNFDNVPRASTCLRKRPQP